MSGRRANTIPETSLADVWRAPLDPRWRDAHAIVKQVFVSVAAKHPRLRALTGADRQDVVEDLLAGFWCHLAANPATLEASRVRSAGALRVESWRFLDRSDAGLEVGTPRAKLLRHLQRMKVQPALRGDDRFTTYSRNLWALTRWPTGPGSGAPRCDVRALDEATVRDDLPALASRLDSQKPGQAPPLVDAELLPAFLERALARSMRPRTDWALTRLVWDRLEPSPDAVLLGTAATREDRDDNDDEVRFSPAPAPDEADARVARERWARRVDVVASSIVETLTPRQQLVVLGHFRNTPQQEQCERLGISRGTLNNEMLRFREKLAAAIEADGLDQEDARILLAALLSILEAEAFMASSEA